jgi:ATP-dependent Clp protease adapter protein ClpS
VELDDGGHISYMGPNASHTNGMLMVRLVELPRSQGDIVQDSKRDSMVFWNFSLVGDVPDSKRFLHGVELINDDQTPMQFVVDGLRTILGLEQDAAVGTMSAVHRNGRAIVAVSSGAEADRASNALVTDARSHGHPLVCRAIGGVADSMSP